MFQLIAKSKTEVDIQLYGGISTWDGVRAKDVTNLLTKAKNDGYSKINLRIHSPGGSVSEGLAIYNVIQNLGLQVVAYIDGIAASMASVMMLACDEVYASKLARVMTHQARAGVQGTASQLREVATQLESTNEQFAEIYATKAKKDKKWVMENWLPDGKDVWFTAKQALEAGLVDKIVEPPVKIDTSKKAESDVEIFAMYDEAFESFGQASQESNDSNSNSNPTTMEIKLSRQQALLLLTALGVSMQAQASLKDEAIPEMLLEKAEAVKAKLAEYDTLKAQLQATEKTKVLEAIKARGGTQEQQNKYVALIDKIGTEATLELVNDLPTPQDLTAVASRNTGGAIAHNPNGRTYEQWAKESPTELLKMSQTQPERYAFLASDLNAKL
jgi:ATP-dependent Clp endopeptidase proteolytic subunit ClpP